MKTFLLRIVALLAVAAVLSPGVGGAVDKKKRKVVPASKKGAASELPTIKRVNGDKVTIGQKVYQVNDLTRITVNGGPGTVKDLSPGMQVSVAGGVLRYGKGKSETLYKATRISARADNKLEKKRNESNRKQAERARQANRNNNRRGKK